jgi:hypothetical protein
MTLEIQVLAWDRHKNVAGLNQLLGSHDPTLPSRYLDNLDHFQRNVYCNYVEIEWEHIIVSMNQCRIKYIILVKILHIVLPQETIFLR